MGVLEDYAVAVWIELPDRRVLLVRDPKRPPPVYWKCPGGRSLPEESAEQAAIREAQEETGIIIDQTILELVYTEPRGNHSFVFFRASVPTLTGLKSRGDEGELVKAFTRAHIAGLPDFFSAHRRIAQRAKLL